ncbi:MAG TPA: hypothetical protein VG267_07635 [Terracidiphilus sp.]|jgi:hypothetical protein|nr:hypothetical protein [Terracidiphilus sp.]
MKRNAIAGTHIIFAVPVVLLTLAAQPCRADQPTPAAMRNYDSYIGQIEARLTGRHQAVAGFLVPADEAKLRQGDLVIERVTPDPALGLRGAMLHHWRGTAFAPGAHAADFERLMSDYAGYPKYFSPQVLSAHVLSHAGNHYQVTMRVQQKHVLTVVLDTAYDVGFGRLDPAHGYSISRSTQISEIASPGTQNEHALTAAQDHGFLWRLNTYWSYEERDGGLYLQIESVSLTRAIPPGLGWAIGPFVESVPRESLEFTLRSVCDALRKAAGAPADVDAADERKKP